MFQTCARPVAALFALTVDGSSLVGKQDLLDACVNALRIATIGYVFMGFSVAVQGVLQGLGEVYSPVIISALRTMVFVFPVVWLFTIAEKVSTVVWWTFPIAEVLTAAASAVLLAVAFRKKLPQAQTRE